MAPGDKLFVATKEQLLMPPSYMHVLQYYQNTNTLLQLGEGGNNTIACFEGMHTAVITSLAMSGPRTLITGGADNLVRVWHLGLSAPKQIAYDISLRRTLYGHVGPVRCLAVCASYNLLLSGSDDRTCIVWDLARLKVRRE